MLIIIALFRDDPTCEATIEDDDTELSSEDDENENTDRSSEDEVDIPSKVINIPWRRICTFSLEISEGFKCPCKNCIKMPSIEEDICCLTTVRIRPEVLLGT